MSLTSHSIVRTSKKINAEIEITATEIITLSNLDAGFASRILSAQATLKESASAEVDKASYLTAVIAADAQSVTIYAWKATAAGNTALIASTAAATASVLLEVEVG